MIMSGFTVTLCSLISLVPLVSYGNGKASSGQNSLGAVRGRVLAHFVLHQVEISCYKSLKN